MIASLKGLLLEKSLNEATIDVNGVGYRVRLSILTLSALPELNQPVFLRIRTVVREDAFDLFGFMTRTEEELFLLLTSVSNVGPKVAMSVLSGLEVEELVTAIAKGDVARLTKIHGVGRKTAERLVLELKEKVKTIALEAKPGGKRPVAISGGMSADLVSALINLGYKEPQAEATAQSVMDQATEGAPFELLFREALKTLRG